MVTQGRLYELHLLPQVQRCVEILSRAKRPLVVLGSQALLPPTPASKLR